MCSVVRDEPGNQEEGKIIARHLVKDYILKEKKGLFARGQKKVVHAVKDLSLEIPQGKITGVLGINGAGKTTTIRMLASIIAPTSGSLTMNGVDAVKKHLWVKERINVISGGERNLYWRLTAKENLRYFGSLYGLSGASLNEKIADLLETVGLEEAADIPVERYSKGMKQRLQIARGLINDPEYLFMDEPTLGLDIVIAKEIRRLVQELAKEKKKGILLTTHYIREAEELCDYIYVLDKGEIIAQGTREELKELFMYKPQLLIQVKPSDDQEYLALLKEEGEKTADEHVLNLLMKHQIQVEGLSVQEPELEEVLMKIISQPDRRSQ
ncbi:ABC transporter ATP-binding protein [Lachnospiraceae bacterium 48-42]|nr:ABC transporter ATP-binding protein [Dorea sp.]